MRAHMQTAHIFAIGDDLFRHAEPPQHSARQRHAGVFVAIGMPLAVLTPCGGNSLAQIMRQRRIDKGFRFLRLRLLPCGGMQHQHAMDIGIALRMIAWGLRHVDQRCQLAKPRLQRIRLTEHIEKHIRRIACHRLFQFAPHARGRQLIRLHRPHLRQRFFVRRQMKPGRKLRAPQHAERVFAKAAARHGAQNAELQILPPAEGIDNFSGQRIPQNRVDGEIPPRRRPFKRKRRIRRHVKITVLRAGSAFQPRHGQIDVRIPEGENAEPRAAFIHCAELRRQLVQPFGRKTVDLAVDIRAFPAKQRVAHTAADQHRPAAQRLCPLCNPPNRLPLNFSRHTPIFIPLSLLFRLFPLENDADEAGYSSAP